MAKDIILVPVDFERASLDALALAREYAEKLGLEVMLLHSYNIPVVVYPGMDPILVQAGLLDEVGSAAKQALEQLAQASGGLRSVLRRGDPAAVILETIEKHHVKLVAMGTHGRRGLSHLFLGSVAEDVIARSPVPVLIVRAKNDKAAASPDAAARRSEP